MIRLRNLREEDAPFMLEWMKDPEIQKRFRKKMNSVSIEDVKAFCRQSQSVVLREEGQSIHFAIVDSGDDEYLGTISLKNISIINGTAEYAISTRKKARGKGIAEIATRLVLDKAFEEYKMHRVFLSVYSDNASAIHLYEKCGFRMEGEFREHIKRSEGYINWRWYGILESEYKGLKNLESCI